jgi:dTDP-4-dehydrorhamnose reductase
MVSSDTDTMRFPETWVVRPAGRAVAIQEEALKRKLLDHAIPIRAIASREYPRPARRPAYSVLDKRRTAEALGYPPPHWRTSLRTMLDELAAA